MLSSTVILTEGECRARLPRSHPTSIQKLCGFGRFLNFEPQFAHQYNGHNDSKYKWELETQFLAQRKCLRCVSQFKSVTDTKPNLSLKGAKTLYPLPISSKIFINQVINSDFSRLPGFVTLLC